MDIEYKTSYATFVWNTDKARINRAKHGIAFEDAVEVFCDPLALVVCDEEHSYKEFRMQAIGTIRNEVVVFVVFTERDVIRIISARRASAQEKKTYEGI